MKMILATMFMFLFASPVFAVPLYCEGNITRVLIRDDGDVLINSTWRSNYTKSCNLKHESPGTVTCSMWASYAAKALENQTKVIHYLDVSEGTTCSNLPTYGNTPPTGYLMLINQ